MSIKKEKFYITTSIPYLNAAPHLGFALEAVQADILARHARLRGKDVFFLSGADEHGAKIARAAEAAKKTPKEFVDEKIALFSDLLKKLDISNDDFIRTSDKLRHWPGAELLWKKMAESGDIYKGMYKGLYCVGHEAFITEKDLIDGKCELHKTAPEAIEEENYFFKLSKHKEKIKEAILKGEMRILPESRKNETLNILNGAEDISFSRPSKDISWGIPVPDDATQTMYVWCDALSNYITALGYGEKEAGFKKYWPADAHVIGKDIMRFHTIFWPAMLLSAGLPLPKTIFIHGFISVKGEKMSKSTGNVVDPLPLIEQYGKDALRFYLAHEVQPFSDSDYTEQHYKEVYEGSLVNGLGNILSRTLKMTSSYPSIPKPDEHALGRFPIRKNLDLIKSEEKQVSVEEISPVSLVDSFIWPEYKKAIEEIHLANAIEVAFAFLRRLDEYIEDYKPYKMLQADPESAKIILWHLAYSLASAAWMLKPFLPETSDKMLTALGVDLNSKEEWREFKPGEAIHLFPRIK